MGFGYTLFTEDHDPRSHAQQAKAAGLDFLATSDHYHPWLDAHENSCFAWTLLGAIADRTERIELAILAVGRDQEGFFRFWREELRPALGS